jgi:hypothetical protein
MTKRRTGWRKMGVAAALACALLLPTSVAFAQVPTPRPAPTATRAAVSGSPAAGEPMQDMMLLASALGALVIGGFTLQRFARRRA